MTHEQVFLRRAGVRESLPFPNSSGKFRAAPVQPRTSPGFRPAVLPDNLPDEEPFDDPDPYNDQLNEQYDEDDDEGYEDYDPNEFARSSPVEEAAAVEDTLEAYRERFEQNPQETLKGLGIETEEGGYRIGDIGQSPYLRQAGLQSGDVILSVNGRPLTDIQSNQLEIDNILAQGTARIEIQRGARRFFITASIPRR